MTQHNVGRPRLLCAGYLTLDLIVRNLEEQDYWQAVGGTCGNVSVFASALGADVSLLARIGEDRRGGLMMEYLNEEGVDTSSIEKVERLRTPGIVEHIRGTAQGLHRFSYKCPACKTLLPKHAVVSRRQAKIEANCIDQYDAFFFDRATPATLILAEAAQKAGLLVMFEPPRIPRTDIANRAAAFSDIVKVSVRRKNHSQGWNLRKGTSTRFIIETLGACGVRASALSSDGWSEWKELPAIPQSHISDSAGAGDWFTAGLLTSLPIGRETIGLETILASVTFGQKLSAISLAFDGPGGALTALGGPGIIDAVKSSSDLSFTSNVRDSSHQVQPDSEANSPSHCKLCLTAQADYRP